MSPTKFVLALAGLLSFSVPASAQRLSPRDSIRDDRFFSFYDRGPYRPTVPRPESILGYDIGRMNTTYMNQEKVLLGIANAATDRVVVEPFGSSYERRPMRLFIVSDPENIKRLDAIRKDLDILADPRGRSRAELDAIAARTPAVVWLSFSVHGDESPGFETVMQVLYQLAASEEPATTAALKNTIIVLNPSANPDGHERFTVWYNSVGVETVDPSALERRQPWSISGRFNHYRFDMNRDVLATTQREPQLMVRQILKWHPMVAVDLHGQVNNYFFPPGSQPINENLGPLFDKWMDVIGRGNAAAFDRYGWSYFVRDVFDLYGPFYWDIWPALTGATGMTYETDGGGHRGIFSLRDDGTLLSFRDGVAKHYVAALATIETTSARAAERVRDYLKYREQAIEDGRKQPMKRVVLVPGIDPVPAIELVAALRRAGIEVRKTTAAFSSNKAHAYSDGGITAKRFDAGVYVVDMAQPQMRVAKAILEPSPALDTAFARKQIERFKRNLELNKNEPREGFEFYDVTAWSLPIAFGVEAYWTEDAPEVAGTQPELAGEEPPLPQAIYQPQRQGGELVGVDLGGGISGGRARTAYLYSPERIGSKRLTYDLLREQYRVLVATDPIEAGGKRWPKGTFVIRVARNDTTVHARLDSLARWHGVAVTPVNTMYTDTAHYGIGSGTSNLREPKIAVISEGGGQTDYGAVWWTFERRFGIRFTPIQASSLNGDLSAYNVIIAPALFGVGKEAADKVKSWIQSGGTLITMGSATAWASSETVGITAARQVGGDPKDTTVKPPTSVPGALFATQMNRDHWLTYGFEQKNPIALVEGSFFLRATKEGSNVITFPKTGDIMRGGFAWPDQTEKLLRGTALVINERIGGGHAVLFTNDPMFRAWWRAFDHMVLNAIILGPSM